MLCFLVSNPVWVVLLTIIVAGYYSQEKSLGEMGLSPSKNDAREGKSHEVVDGANASISLETNTE